MTGGQREVLFEKWSCCGNRKQKETVNEYLKFCCGSYSQEGFENFLKDRLKFKERKGGRSAWGEMLFLGHL